MRNLHKFKRFLLFSFFFLGFLALSKTGWGQATRTWTNSNGNSRWNTAANWSGGTAPVAGDNVIIPIAATITRVPNLSLNSLSVSASVSFAANGAATTLTINNTSGTTSLNVTSGNTLTFGDGTTKNPVHLTLSAFSSASNIAGNLVMTANTTLAIQTTTLNITGNLTGAGSVTMSSGTLNIGGNLATTGIFTAGTGTVNFNGSGAQTIPNNNYNFNNIQVNNTNTAGATFGGAVTTSNITGNITVGNLNTGSLLNTNNLTVARTTGDGLTIAAGSIFDAGTTSIGWDVAGQAVTINGTLRTANSAGFSGAATTAISSTNTPTITLGANSTIEYDAPTGGQTVTSRTYSNLTMSNSSGTQTTSGAVTVNGTLTTTSGGTLNMGTNQLLGSLTAANLGTLRTQNTTNPAIPTGDSWSGTVTFDATTGTQFVPTGTYNKLTFSNTSGTQTAVGALTVNGTLTTTAGGTLNMGANQLLGTLATVINGGAIQTQNTTGTPIPTGKTWGGSILYDGVAQTIATGTYNNLTLSGSGAKTIGTASNGVLTTGILNIDHTSGATASVSNTGVKVNELRFSDIPQVAGTWGSSGSVATNKTDTYFTTGATGYLNALTGAAPTPSIAISDNGTQVTAANVTGGTSNIVLHKSALAVTLSDAILSGMTCTIAGTYTSADIINLKVWYQTSSSFTGSGILLSTFNNPGAAGAKTFPSFTSQTINNGNTGYIFITADIPCAAINATTINVGALATSNFSFSSGTILGSTTAGGIQTIQTIPANVSGNSASGANASSTLNWTNPIGCYNEFMIVAKANSSVTGTPTGDGSAYNANLSFIGNGTAFGGGKVVYKGTSSPQTVTNLTNGTTYYFEFYTRNGTNWSAGVETTVTPGASTSASDYFRSKTSGDWNAASTWESSANGSTWISATLAPTVAAHSILIQSGHTVYTTISPSSNNLTVNGTYEHKLNGGTIPSATWDVNSTCLITGVTANAPGGGNQAFGNFTWNCTGQSSWVAMSPTTMSILGNLEVDNSGPNPNPNVYDFAINQDITVRGDLLITGGIYRVCYNANRTQNIIGNVSITGGQLLMNSSDTNPWHGTLNVAGNFNFASGTINARASSPGSNTSDINFNGTGAMQTYTSGGTITSSANANIINFTVISPAYLQMGTGASPSTLSAQTNGGTNTFMLSSGATLGIISPDGISTSGAIGNIQVTGARTYSSGASYIYNGNTNQLTGNGLSQNTPANITISNPGNTVTLSANSNMNGVLTVNAGSNLALTNTLGATTAPSGVILEIGTSGSAISGDHVLHLGGNVTVNDITGASGATISCPVALDGTRIFNVYDDVTAAADLTISGIISTPNGLTKNGAGTMVLTGINTNTGATTISAGALRLNPSSDITLNTQIILSGGILSTTGVASGRTITNFASLKLDANSSINLGSNNHSLNFANSSAITWTGTTLTINGWTGTGGASGTAGKIFFGSSSGTLTAAQLSSITFTGFPGTPILLGTGELVPSAGCVISGDPDVFGAGIWNVYAYQGSNIDLSGITYKGYYTESNFSFSTQDRWNQNGSPDEAINPSNYQGCPVTHDNHTFVYKRVGFPTGTYQITVGHDDSYQLYIDGSSPISSSPTWDNNVSEVLPTTYVLSGTSTIEFRVAEIAGGSRGALTFMLQCANPTSGGSIMGNQTICLGGDPVAFTNSGLPTGYTGTLEYKWQSSITGSSSGFSDISGATGLTYDIPSGLAQTTWYKRQARVICSADWSGAAASNVLEVTVNAIPTAPTAGNGGAVCEGSTLSLTASNVSGATYSWTGPNSFSSALQNPTITGATTAASGTYSVTATVNGCTSPAGTTTATVNPDLPASANIGASATTICSGTSVTFTATPTNGGTAPVYQWKKNGTNVGSNNPTYTDNTLINGNVITCALISNATPCLTGSPATSNTITMTVNAGQNPTVSIAANPGLTICSGTSVTFTATASNIGGGTVMYNFKVGGTSVQNTSSNTYVSTTLTNGNSVTCDITITGGTCLASTTASSNAMTMTVNPNLTPTVSIGASATIICSGTSVTFTATAGSTGGGTVSYNFKVNGTSVQSGAGNIYSSTALKINDAVTCDITITGGACLASTTASSNSVTMTVNLIPTVITANTFNTCSGEGPNISLIASPTSTFSWTIGTITGSITGASASSGTSINQTLTNPIHTAAGTVQYIVTPTAGLCVGSPYTITVTVNPTPDPGKFN